MTSPLLTAAEAAQRIGVSESTIRREIAAGRLRATRIRRLVRVDEAEIGRYLAQQQETPCPSVSEAPDIRSELHSATAAALSALYPSELPVPTRGRSKLRSFAARSKLRVVGNQRA